MGSVNLIKDTMKRLLAISVVFIVIIGWIDTSTGAGGFGHFPTPLSSPVFSDFLGTVMIDGTAAEPGDEVAFYDPNGVLCGLYVVQVAGQYGVLHVYGDDPTTTGVDEGALDGDQLTVRVWDASRGVELSGAELQLTAGVPPVGTSFTVSSDPPVWHDQQGVALNIDTVSHFGTPSVSPYVSNYIGALNILGSPAEIGDEVGVFDSNAILRGSFRVITAGQYGVVQVYGDDPSTDGIIEGAVEGEVLTFKVWDRSTGQEDILTTTPGSPQASFISSALPPIWSSDVGYVIDLALTVDKNLTVTLVGNGSGTVTSDVGGIDCGTTCSDAYTPNTSVTLTATPFADSFFTGWSDSSCPGTASCQLTMDAEKNITATFESFLWTYDGGAGFSRLVMPDLDGDGVDDLLLLLDNEWVKVVSGITGTELWSYQISTANRARRGFVVINDLDGDGVKDIIVVLGTSGNDYNQNVGDDAMYAVSGAVVPPGARLIWGAVTIGCGLRSPVVLSDVNSDGFDDIFAMTMSPSCTSNTGSFSSGDAGYHFSGADGSLIWNYTTYAEGAIWDITGGTVTPDLNGDGLEDIVVSGAGGSSGVEAWKGGAVKGQLWRALTGNWILNRAVVGDLTGDGIAEIAVGKYNTLPLKLFVLNGSSGAVVWEFSLGNTPNSAVNIGDVNGDGFEDIAIGTYFVNNVGGTDYHAYALNGDPAASTRVIWSYDLVDTNNYVYSSPDIDGDGFDDLLVLVSSDRVLALNSVDGTLLWEKKYSGNPGGLQLGEFDGTGGRDYISSVGTIISASPTGSAVDFVAPIITLLGNAFVTVEVGSTYGDDGATAADNVDGDLTTDIVVVNSVDTNALGTYTVTYDVDDAGGNSAAQVTRTVTVVDTTLPVIGLVGDDPQVIDAGGVYTELGATATDNYDGSISGQIIIDSSDVNTAVVGIYAVRYNVTDSSGNDAIQVTRIVNVLNTLPAPPVAGGGPLEGAVSMSTSPYLFGSPFTDTTPDDSHQASQWQVCGDNGCLNVVHDSGADTGNLDVYQVPDGTLAHLTTYWWQYRYQDSHGDWSEWSALSSFTTGADLAVDEGTVKTFGGTYSEMAYSIASTADGGLVLAGKTYRAVSGYDMLIIKLDAQGNIQWQQTLDAANGWQSSFAVIQTVDGGYGVNGSDSSSQSVVVRMDDYGRLLWSRSLTSFSSESDKGIAATPDNGLVVLGRISVAGRAYDIALAKLDAVGNIVWQHNYGSTGNDYGYDVRSTSDGGLIIAGRTGSDMALLRLDGLGRVIWDTVLVGTNTDQLRSVVETANGDFLVAGESYDNTSYKYNGFVGLVNASGVLIWQRQYKSSDSYIYFTGATTTADGSLVVSGYGQQYYEYYDEAIILAFDSSGALLWQRSIDGAFADKLWGVAATATGVAVAGETWSFGQGQSDILMALLDSNGQTRCRAAHDGNMIETTSSLDASTLGLIALNDWSDPASDANLVALESDLAADDICPVGANQNPVVETPFPADSGAESAWELGLTWNGSDPDAWDSLTYDLYLDSVDGTTLAASGLAVASYISTDLLKNTTYHWQVVAHDNNGGIYTSPLWSFTTNTNAAPIADPGGPYASTGCEEIQLLADASNDSDGFLVPPFEWDLDNDGIYETVTANRSLYHQFGFGVHTVGLRVTDNDGVTATGSTTVTVTDAGPTAAFVNSPAMVSVGGMVSFTDQSESCEGISSWAWDFDNDTVIDSTDQNPSYTFTQAGTYTVSLTVTEADSQQHTLAVTNSLVVHMVPTLPIIYVDTANSSGPSWDGSQTDPFATIQDAVNAAETGAVIRVARGVYNENVLIAPASGTSLTIEGGWDSGFATRAVDPALTTINGGQTGAALAFDHITVDTTQLHLEGFTLTNGSGYESYTNVFRGGGLYVNAVSNSYLDLSVHNCVVNNNGRSASSFLGNGAYISLYDGRVSISNSSFSNNYYYYDQWNDGGLYLQAYGRGEMVLSSNTVSGNNASGVYLFADMMPVLVVDSLFENNNTNGLRLNSGANRNVVLQGNTYSNNITSTNSWNRGGISIHGYSSGRVLSSGEIFDSNSGSGVYCGGGFLELHNATIIGNSRYGIDNDDICDLTLRDSLVIGNDSDGIYSYNDEYGSSRILIDRSRIVNNGGDGISLEVYYYEVVRQTLEVVNSVVSGNVNGIYLEADDYYDDMQFVDVSVIHSTIAGNSSNGIDMWTSDQPPMRLNVFNSIVRDNTYDDIYNDEVQVFVGHTDYSVYNDYFSSYSRLTDLGGNIDTDPLFDIDFHLSDVSPCIDAAAPQWRLPLDIDGQARPQLSGYDMGADEFVDLIPPEIILLGDDPVTVEAGTPYEDAGATASDNIDGDLTSDITVNNPVDKNIPGTYTITYDVVDAAGNGAVQVTRTVIVEDTTPPEMSVSGNVVVEASGALTSVDLGTVTASDLVDGMLTPSADNPGPYPVGTTTVTWSATDSSDNTGTATQQVTVNDTTGPVITLTGANPLTIKQGQGYTELGASAVDLVDGTVTVTLDTTNVNTSIAGAYTVSYSATDGKGNKTTVTRTVNVTPVADLQIVKSGPQFVSAGGSVLYIFVITNNGPATAENVIITDSVPAMTGAEYSLDGGETWASWAGSVNIGSRAAGEVFTGLRLRGTVSGSASGIFTNAATVSSDQFDGDGSNDSSSPSSKVRADNPLPEALSPENGTIFAPGVTVTLEAGSFIDLDGHSHLETHWRVRRADMAYGDESYDLSFNAQVSSGDMFAHSITGGLFEGLEYVWQVGFVDSWNDRIFWSEENTFAIGTSSTSEEKKVSAGNSLRSYRMVSIDYWPKNADCLSVFNLTRYDTTQYRIGTYDPLSGAYLECNDGLMIKPGRSYWVLARQGISVDVYGVPVSTVADLEVKLQYNPDTENGWNMIGVPNGRDYYWEGVEGFTGVEVVQYDPEGLSAPQIMSLEGAVAAGLLDSRVWVWENGGYTSYEPDDDPLFMLIHREGFWVKALASGVSLRFTVDAQQAVVTSGVNQWIASLSKSTRRWLKKWVFAATAHADGGDGPPLPIGGLGTGSGAATEGGSGGCFIATAAYGSYMEPHVEILKDFRDQILLPSIAGRQLVKIYYEYSPSAADFIAGHDSLRTVVRVVLLPVVAMSSLWLSFGFVPVLILLVLCVMMTCGAGSYLMRMEKVE